MRPVRATPLTSPVLVGRDDLLELADRRLDEAHSGRGQVLLLAGEAGIGKTRLLGAIERRAALGGMVVVSAAAFPRDLEVAGGPLLDLARALDSESGRRSELGRGLHARLAEADARRRGDAHRHRRLLVADLADLVLGLGAEGPLFVSFEDLHWADDLALEVLGQVARRIRGTPMLIVGTYRSDELYPRVPMRDWRSRLLTQRLAEEARLARLDVAQTALLARALVGDPTAVPHELVVQVHRRSDGSRFMSRSSWAPRSATRTVQPRRCRTRCPMPSLPAPTGFRLVPESSPRRPPSWADPSTPISWRRCSSDPPTRSIGDCAISRTGSSCFPAGGTAGTTSVTRSSATRCMRRWARALAAGCMPASRSC